MIPRQNFDESVLWRAEPVEGAVDRISALFGGDNKALWPWWDGLHNGLDFGAECGEPVMAVRGGTVFECRFDEDGYGWYCKVGTATNHVLYAHFSRLAVKDGDVVQAGDVIGYAGMTGNATGCHVHIGVRVPSVSRAGNALDGWVNPLPFFWQWLLQRGFLLSDHWDGYHRSSYDVEALRRWSPPVCKLLKRSYDDAEALAAAIDVGGLIILRNQAISETERIFSDPVGLAREHANFWRDEIPRIEAKTGLSLPRHLIAVEGVNEPHEWIYGDSDADQRRAAGQIAVYGAEFARNCARFNLPVVAPNFGKGWTGNGGGDGVRPHWDALALMAVVFVQFGGLMASHEYADAPGGVVDGKVGWLIGRYRWQYGAGSAFRHVMRVLTEVGIADDEFSGWRSAGLTEEQYMDWLRWLDEYYRDDPSVLGACIFSRDGVTEQWSGFDIRAQAMMELIIAYAEERRRVFVRPEHSPAGSGDLEARVAALEAWARSFQ